MPGFSSRRVTSAASNRATSAGSTPAKALRTSRAALAGWLQPASGRALADHLYLVDPHGGWMLRTPAEVDPARLKRDLDKLLRASSAWDQPGR